MGNLINSSNEVRNISQEKEDTNEKEMLDPLENEMLELRFQQASELRVVLEEELCNMSVRKIRDAHCAKERLLTLWEKEKSFLQKMEEGDLETNQSRLSSSNFPHLHALLCIAQSPYIEDICEILFPIEFPSIISKLQIENMKKITQKLWLFVNDFSSILFFFFLSYT